MPMITLWGRSKSRASRCLIALEELGVPYRLQHIESGAQRSPDYLAVNPNGLVPTLVIDDVVLWESLAINLHLAERFGRPPLWPATVTGRAQVYQWSFWAMAEVERRMIAISVSGQRSDADGAALAKDGLKGALGVLEARLQGREWLLGADYSLADVNTAPVLSEPHEAAAVWGLEPADLDAFPAIRAWLARCDRRPSYERVRRLP